LSAKAERLTVQASQDRQTPLIDIALASPHNARQQPLHPPAAQQVAVILIAGPVADLGQSGIDVNGFRELLEQPARV